MMLEGNGLDDAGGLRRRIEMLVMQVRAEKEKVMMECLANLLLLLAATWNDWAWMELEKTGLEFQEPVGIPVCSCAQPIDQKPLLTDIDLCNAANTLT